MGAFARRLAFTLAVTTLAACGSGSATSSVEALRPTTISSSGGGQAAPDDASLITDDDALMCRLEQRFDGFAGVVQKGGGMVEFLFSKDIAPNALEELKQQLASRGFAISGRSSIRRVRYDFCTLRRWYRPLSNEVFEIDGVVLTDIDEMRNRIVVGVVDRKSSEDEIARIAARFGIPKEAISVEQMEPYQTDVLHH